MSMSPEQKAYEWELERYRAERAEYRVWLTIAIIVVVIAVPSFTYMACDLAFGIGPRIAKYEQETAEFERKYKAAIAPYGSAEEASRAMARKWEGLYEEAKKAKDKIEGGHGTGRGVGGPVGGATPEREPPQP